MDTQAFRTVIHVEQWQPMLTIPEAFVGQTVEVIIRPVPMKAFRSIQRIKIDTRAFRFDREEANARENFH